MLGFRSLPPLHGLLTATYLVFVLPAAAQTIREPTRAADAERSGLTQVTTFEHQVTGVTVSEDGRIFVNFPRWTEDVPVSVAEVTKDGSIRPYPNAEWNAWRNAKTGEVSPQNHFFCVQSVVADGRGSVWVLDPAAPNLERVVKNGPKLVQIDLASNTVKRTIPFDESVAPQGSYLNDVRFAPDGRFAYSTDSGRGAIVVVDLGTGRSRRVLDGHPSTQAEEDVIIKADGQELRRPDGRPLLVNADGIELSKDGQTLYWQALTGRTLYRVPTSVLQDASASPDAVAQRVEKVAATEPVDGLWLDGQGRFFLSAFQENTVKVLTQDGRITTLVQDPRLRWPDTFAQGPDGALYVTASHIQDSPWFHEKGWRQRNFALFVFMVPATAGSSGRAVPRQ